MTQELVINRGIPASGKSTYAKQWVAQEPKRLRVNRDDIRMQLFNKGFDVDEEFVTKIEDATIRTALQSGYSVIVDDCNIEPKYIKRFVGIAVSHNVTPRLQEHIISLDEAIKRNNIRWNTSTEGPFVPENVIVRMHSRMQKIGPVTVELPDSVELYVAKEFTPQAIIVDVDGTIAHRNPNGRGPFDWMRVDEDTVIHPVANLVRDQYMTGLEVIVVSGRDSICYGKTHAWLCNNGIPFDKLFMRPQGDMRKDSIVKREIFDNHIRNEYNVQYVLDDRQQVVDMWRSLGLTCLQVDYGDF